MRFYCTLAATLLLLSTVLEAKTKKVAKVKEPQDEIEVVGHIALTGGPVRRFLATQHFSSHYLYAEHDSGSSVTLIDVSRIAGPTVLGEVAVPFTGRLDTVAGTAAMMTEGDANVAVVVSAPRTIRILNFSDPLHPVVAREFTGVTATSRDEHRGLIFIANPEGIWILHQKFADDPELEKAYVHQVVYQ